MSVRGKVYFWGLSDSDRIKIGYTATPLSVRKKGLESGQFTNTRLHLLAAVNGTKTQEEEILQIFSEFLSDSNSTETFTAVPELVEYVNWLRQQWWAYLNEDEVVDEMPLWPEWMPRSDRRMPYAEDDPSELIPSHRDYSGPLAGTRWNRLCTPTKTGDDFYTPHELIEAASLAMGWIDWDLASHWQANRVHKIKNYFHIHRSAFDNKWEGNCWLNPPYGDNKPWLEMILKYWESKDLRQLCMLSPVWVFNANQARPVIKRSSAMVLLTPTPSFWGHPNGRTGTNHPHAVIYLGDKADQFLAAFASYGIPMKLV